MEETPQAQAPQRRGLECSLRIYDPHMPFNVTPAPSESEVRFPLPTISSSHLPVFLRLGERQWYACEKRRSSSKKLTRVEVAVLGQYCSACSLHYQPFSSTLIVLPPYIRHRVQRSWLATLAAFAAISLSWIRAHHEAVSSNTRSSS